MTTKAVTRSEVGDDGSCFLFTWASMANGDDGEPVKNVPWADRCGQVTGTFGAGGTVLWEGSNDKTNWATLNNAQGTALSLTGAGVKQIVEVPLWVRPRVSAGDGTTAIVATMIARRPNPMRT